MDAPTPRPLTQLARAAGCAAKVSQADLRAALARLPTTHDPRVLVGHSTSDDAAVIRLTDDVALVETVDIFPPIVDDPYDYGRIAAANALSDIYAMGARPLNALSFVAWPVQAVGLGPLGRVFEGAAAVCDEAGISISGGHSIVDEEPKFGLFVTGLVHPEKIVSNAGLRPDDILVLTKPLGTGILTTAVKRGRMPVEGLSQAIHSMTTLNRAAAEAMVAAQAHAATDITGFGLLGHLGNMLRASSEARGRGLGARIFFNQVPVFENVRSYLGEGLCPAGTRRNLQYSAPNVIFSLAIGEAEQLLLADAQTSGGLLIAVEKAKLTSLIADLNDRGVLAVAQVGEIVESDVPGHIEVG
ncbi:MAG: selenide, water dikinase SelD [Pseudorhodoplanes sp.]|jgi:selenide,water dikinase|nr:selenide, water dikinase SelD [Pseudorhodoplanes sp.]